MKSSEETKLCSGNYKYSNCYYSYTMVGFEFKIPLSDLGRDLEFDIKLRIYEKQVNRGLQISIYVLGINDTVEQNGVRYQLYSDINKTSVIIENSVLFVRSGPGQNYSIKTANFSCSYNGNTLFWYPNETYKNIKGAQQTNPGNVSSELWVNLKYNYGGCLNGKARAVNGTTMDGWAPWVYMNGSGTPATIKTTSLDTFFIEELRTYTVEKNTNTKVLLTLNSTIDQNIKIKAYHNNNLVYENIVKFNGTKSHIINYKIPSNGTIRLEVSNGYITKNIESKIYISSNKEYHITSEDVSGIIEVETPILVVTDKDGTVKEYKEIIQLSAIPYDIDISQGRGISGMMSAISYWYPLDEFALNNDYNVYALYPSQEETMKYEVIDGKIKVNLKKDNIVRNENYDVSYFYHPNILLHVLEGSLYNEPLEGYHYFNGGGIWYPSWDDDLGRYEYQYIGENLGINKITIKRDLSYTIISKMLDSTNGKFIIKRVDNPEGKNIIFKKTFSYDELLDYIKGEE